MYLPSDFKYPSKCGDSEEHETPRLDLAVVSIEDCHCDYVQLIEYAIMLIG